MTSSQHEHVWDIAEKIGTCMLTTSEAVGVCDAFNKRRMPDAVFLDYLRDHVSEGVVGIIETFEGIQP